MRGQSWRCGPWAFCSTLCYSVRIPSVMWARSWRPNSSPRSRSLQVYCSLLKDENSFLFFFSYVITGCHTNIYFLKIFFCNPMLKYVSVLSELSGVLRGLLHHDPARRMTLDQLLLQSWISQPISLAEYSWAEVVPATQTYCECF